jgi:hypothetical protein
LILKGKKKEIEIYAQALFGVKVFITIHIYSFLRDVSSWLLERGRHLMVKV